MQKQLKHTASRTGRSLALGVALFFAVAFLCFSFWHFAWQRGWIYRGMETGIFLIACMFFLLLREKRLRKKTVEEMTAQTEHYHNPENDMARAAYRSELIIERPNESFIRHPYPVMADGAGQMTGAINMLAARGGGNENGPLTTSVFDSLTAHIVIINASGIIIKTNTAWNNFALQNGITDLKASSIGENFFDVCRRFCSEGFFIADKTKAGLEKVLNGSVNEFELEFSCNAIREERWFYMRMKRLESAEGLVLIEQHNITECRRKAIIDAQEKERRFIGEELHDNVNQLLASTLLILEMVNHFQREPEKVNEFAARAKEYTLEAMNEIRKLSHELLPATFDNITLKDIFQNLLTGINLKSQYTLQFQFDESINGLLCQEVQISLYRILQEQVKNILKYADADTIEIAVTHTGSAIRMRTFDNGKGFDTNKMKGGIGLNNMRRRVESFAGRFILNSAPGKGCEIIVEIPYNQQR